MKKYFSLLAKFSGTLILIACAVMTASAGQPSSETFVMESEVVNAAGTTGVSSSVELMDTFGEGITHSTMSETLAIQAGFLHDYFMPPPTPTVTCTPIRSFGGGEILNAAFVFAAPNPMRGSQGNIFFDLAVSSEVTLKVFTTSNNLVISHHWDSLPAGTNKWIWNTSGMANGVYLLWIKAKSADGKTSVAIKKLALLK